MENLMDKNKTSNSYNIMLFPEFEQLKSDVERLRTELSMLIIERDNLWYQECKNIEMAYMLSVGALEYKVYEIECLILRLKRKIELIQEKKNRQEKIILSKIEEILDIEFADYQENLNKQVDKINAAFERNKGRLLTDEEKRELKKLYRTIVKSLHPDLNPELSDVKIKLFQNAIEAYEHGDLDAIRIIDAMVSETVIPNEKNDGFAVLNKEKERLSKLIQKIKDRISEIKSEYPYTMKSLVQSPQKIKVRKNELNGRIKQLNEVLSAYTTRIEETLR
jgi:uncharacterized protein YnzC (UPF0291/DUF896 family)